jgi:serine/threonine-protein kinase HipA
LHQCLLIDQYTEQSDINALLSASGNYMIEQKEAAQIIEEVRTAVKDWRKVSSELQIPQKILTPYCSKWDNL